MEIVRWVGNGEEPVGPHGPLAVWDIRTKA